jgi:hypothetical protein
MNILNQFFKKIYIISSFSTQERIPNLVDDINYELIIAPKKKYFDDNGAFSLISANESIFLKESYLKSESFCILEDDIWFDINYKEKLNFFFLRVCQMIGKF